MKKIIWLLCITCVVTVANAQNPVREITYGYEFKLNDRVDSITVYKIKRTTDAVYAPKQDSGYQIYDSNFYVDEGRFRNGKKILREWVERKLVGAFIVQKNKAFDEKCNCKPDYQKVYFNPNKKFLVKSDYAYVYSNFFLQKTKNKLDFYIINKSVKGAPVFYLYCVTTPVIHEVPFYRIWIIVIIIVIAGLLFASFLSFVYKSKKASASKNKFISAVVFALFLNISVVGILFLSIFNGDYDMSILERTAVWVIRCTLICIIGILASLRISFDSSEPDQADDGLETVNDPGPNTPIVDSSAGSETLDR